MCCQPLLSAGGAQQFAAWCQHGARQAPGRFRAVLAGAGRSQTHLEHKRCRGHGRECGGSQTTGGQPRCWPQSSAACHEVAEPGLAAAGHGAHPGVSKALPCQIRPSPGSVMMEPSRAEPCSAAEQHLLVPGRKGRREQLVLCRGAPSCG